MILRRLGNKQKIASEIQKYFPPHKIYIEPFFGAGGIFFNKPLAKYNFLNDIDNDVFNLFIVLKDKKDELEKAIQNLPIHEALFNYWKKETEITDINKALRFLFLSNFGYMGKDSNLHFAFNTNKLTLLSNIEQTYQFIIRQEYGTTFMNTDFRNVLNKLVFQKDGRNDEEKTFIYSDPPYFQTEKYQKEWNEKDVIDCMDMTFNSGIKGAMSEFDNPFIIQQAKERNLNVIIIGERQNLKNRRTEILITNYEQQPTLFS